jgi:hypothetical protein
MDPQQLPASGEPQQPKSPDSKSKRRWVSPELTELPRLTDLTLMTGAPIPGWGNTGGSTVF